MVSHDGEDRRGESVKKRSGAGELVPAGSLGQVARDDDQVRTVVPDVGHQRLGELIELGAVVDVRQVDDDRHRGGRFSDLLGDGVHATGERDQVSTRDIPSLAALGGGQVSLRYQEP